MDTRLCRRILRSRRLYVTFCFVFVLTAVYRQRFNNRVIDLIRKRPTELRERKNDNGSLRANYDKLKTLTISTPEEFHATAPRGDEPHLLLILSYQRCGSSFFGDIFSKHSDVMYIYEPLDGLYVDLYGTKEGWNVPSDITNYVNGTARILPRRETGAVTELLSNVFDCNIDALPTAVLYHKFWELFRRHHESVKRFLSCSKTHHLGTVGNCREHALSQICPDRFNTSNHMMEKCRQALESARNISVKQNLNFTTYVKCLDDIRSQATKCDQVLTDICRQKKLLVVKTVRATMDSVEDLIRHHRNLRIIHLIRDPRAVVLSRKHFGSSSYGIYSMLKSIESVNLVKEAQLYCNTVIRDINKRKELQAKYPGVFTEVIYEQFVLDVVNHAKDLYEFVNVPFEEGIPTKLRSKEQKNPTHIAKKWWESLSFGIAKEIADVCKEVFRKVSYNWP